MKEPLGYRVLSRRLARDLSRRVEFNRRMNGDDEPGFVASTIDDRQMRQCERTLARFAAYERTHTRGRR